MIEIHGHRGARARMPENTMNGFRYAMQVGADAIEVDIGMSKDGMLVLNHDRSIDGKLLKDLTWEEIQTFDVGSKPNPDFPLQVTTSNSRIPSLESFLQFFDPYPQVGLNLEIKTCPFHPEETWEPMKFARAILPLLNQYDIAKKRILFQSFDPRMILALKAEGSEHEISYLIDSWSDDIVDTCKDLEISNVSPKVSLLNEERCKLLRDASLNFYVWTSNHEAEWNNLSLWGAKGIITDDPEAALDWRDSKN
ncbi:hypothetical protein GW916_07700 [bacterium]|nr:hypothetical protein [bacterium]